MSHVSCHIQKAIWLVCWEQCCLFVFFFLMVSFRSYSYQATGSKQPHSSFELSSTLVQKNMLPSTCTHKEGLTAKLVRIQGWKCTLSPCIYVLYSVLWLLAESTCCVPKGFVISQSYLLFNVFLNLTVYFIRKIKRDLHKCHVIWDDVGRCQFTSYYEVAIAAKLSNSNSWMLKKPKSQGCWATYGL